MFDIDSAPVHVFIVVVWVAIIVLLRGYLVNLVLG